MRQPTAAAAAAAAATLGTGMPPAMSEAGGTAPPAVATATTARTSGRWAAATGHTGCPAIHRTTTDGRCGKIDAVAGASRTPRATHGGPRAGTVINGRVPVGGGGWATMQGGPVEGSGSEKRREIVHRRTTASVSVSAIATEIVSVVVAVIGKMTETPGRPCGPVAAATIALTRRRRGTLAPTTAAVPAAVAPAAAGGRRRARTATPTAPRASPRRPRPPSAVRLPPARRAGPPPAPPAHLLHTPRRPRGLPTRSSLRSRRRTARWESGPSRRDLCPSHPAPRPPRSRHRHGSTHHREPLTHTRSRIPRSPPDSRAHRAPVRGTEGRVN